jgi:hypothetical protein
MGERELNSVRDGETLRTLANGLEIVRRQKHEWRPDLAKLPRDKLIKRTGKVWGSKFYPLWTLPILVDWMQAVVVEEGWILRPGHPSDTDRLLAEEIGLAAGIPTRRIRVVCDGRYVHAYPISE